MTASRRPTSGVGRAALSGRARWLLGLGLLVALGAAPATQDLGATDCTADLLQARASAGTTITRAALVPASGDLPPHCQIDATTATPGNAVAFRLGLPADWNDKFYFEGVGGFGGSIGSLRAGLARGYASASTDTGHQGVTTDASWAAGSPAKAIDFAHRGTHAAAVAARALTGAFYRRPPRYAYFNGCSNGGRQALTEAQRYPDDFDGIIAGNPSFGSLGQARRALIYQTLLASPEHVVPAAKLQVIARAVLASCDARDGLADGLISDPAGCPFRPETLLCSGGDGADCLTAAQVETVKAIYDDVHGPNGLVLHGFPPGHEDGPTGWQQWITGATPPERRPDGTLTFGRNAPLGYRFQDGFLRYLTFADEPGFDWRTFSLERHGARLAGAPDAFSPVDADLTAFVQRGGRLLAYHGWADPGLSAYETVAYYERVRTATPGSDRAVRLFMAPGMHHCPGNGPGPNTFDMLSALEQWVEHGVAPERIVATHATGGSVHRTRLLCPYPQVARYTGTGSVDDAGSFRCEAPAARDTGVRD